MATQKNSKAPGLPAFVIARNTQAIKGGLTIAKQTASRWLLSTAYEGAPEGFIEARFVADVPKFRKAVAATTKHLAACHNYMAYPHNPTSSNVFWNLYRVAGGRLRLTITREPIPKRHWSVSKLVDGYECFSPLHGLYNVYTAPSFDDLERAQVLPKAAIDKVAAESNNQRWTDVRGQYDRDKQEWIDGTRYWVWELERLNEGMFWRFSVVPSGVARAEKEDKQKAKKAFKTADDYRAHLAEVITWFGRVIEDSSSAVTRYGKQYTLDRAAFERLQIMLSEAESLIETAPILVGRDPDLVAEDQARERAQLALHSKLTEAGANVDLQSFLAKVVPITNRENPKSD